jgi:hypothetical protein
VARGVHGRQGPPPDPKALRREKDAGEWVTLAGGREGEPPAWPLSKASARELVLWAGEWRRPQAVMWEAQGQELEVAMYVRCVAAAERRDATVAARTLVRQQQEALGLSVPGLLRNRWRIAPAVPEVEAVAPRPVGGTRDRFKVVPGGA